ncbi:uncharacterized protein TRUGW13939_02069 [Talaromyces rugulosus]|uniref:DUF7624 domain-containing protein n=1 Tax=Talaromyces rugulosus TaxID=121627 RepID=A0A7H8QM27_TALRU|nr:uncharacterized protein TRUGW13939_02069 [Talaromyces rugulosus]QKX54979.1 hypothetical protein TRUGW13939_02069 [Talaromyces rugulosus]
MSDNQTVDASVMEEEQATVNASESPNSSPGRTTQSNRNSNSHVTTTAPFNPMSRKRKVPGSLQSDLTIQTSDNQSSLFEPRLDDDDAPQSVIHAPAGFGNFVGKSTSSSTQHDEKDESSSVEEDTEASDSQAEHTQTSSKKSFHSPVSPPPITTAIPPVKDWSDRATPRAQTRQEIEEFERRPHSTSLEDIPESTDPDPIVATDSDAPVTPLRPLHAQRNDIAALWTALGECWTLCNTLATLSHNHRERLFNSASKGDMQELAWKSCWKLCQRLYECRDSDYASQVEPTLDLCRDFCQALFEVRARDNEDADSVLRVSFELNNHLYNSSDRGLPSVFRERTLDFYITLCHRLMKQRMHLAEETDSLLHACWSLAEMLFSIRQSKREGRNPDEELLGSAVQACWELCDLFREGWTQIRPDRGTPRPSQTTFSQAYQEAKESAASAAETHQQTNPETPTTIFDDTATVSPDEAPIPNILVLGHAQGPGSQTKWSSNASTLSGRSRSSEQTSSTNTVITPAEEPNLIRLKLLITKAALNSGYQRGGSQNLASFAKSLSSDSFGPMAWQIALLDQYKKLVTSDPAFKVVGIPGHAAASDVGKAVQAMAQDGQYAWLRDLYRLVFGFHPEEAGSRRNVALHT